MNQLVEFDKSEIWAESNMVARKIGMKHNDFMKTAKLLVDKMNDLRGEQLTPKFKFEQRNYRGRDFEMCLMSREFFSLVMMRFETKKAFEWQIKFNAAFYAMEDDIRKAKDNKNDPAWAGIRGNSVAGRIEETDAIKEFVEYATTQGSTKANFYYKHITNATYKALGLMVQKNPKLRDQLDIYEISELILAERLAKDMLRKYMSMGRNYKDIYESVKNDLLHQASIMRIDAR